MLLPAFGSLFSLVVLASSSGRSALLYFLFVIQQPTPVVYT